MSNFKDYISLKKLNRELITTINLKIDCIKVLYLQGVKNHECKILTIIMRTLNEMQS